MHIYACSLLSAHRGGSSATWAGLVVQQEPWHELRLVTRMMLFLLVKETRSEEMCLDDG